MYCNKEVIYSKINPYCDTEIEIVEIKKREPHVPGRGRVVVKGLWQRCCRVVCMLW